MLLFAQMKHSLLALQIGLWFHPGAVGALVLTTEPKNRHRGRRFKGSLSSSLMGQSSVASPVSLSSSNDNLVESLPVIRRHQRHSVFSETNVVSKFMPFPHRELCRRSLPTPPPSEVHQRKPNRRFWEFPFHLENENEKRHDAGPVSPLLRKDVRVQFDDPTIGAHQLLERCGVIISKNDEQSHLTSETITTEETETVEHLASVLSFFQSVAAAAESPSGTSNNVKCMARIVSTVGSSGVKCPRWHADHVPVRLVMSILGPGCDYIQENISTEESRRLPRIVNRRALNSLDVDDTMKANDIIVPPSLLYKGRTQGEGSNSIIKHAREGEAVLLMGRKWEDEPAAQPPELEDGDALYSNLVLAAVHRSPTLMPYQERILLTVDLAD